MGCIENDEGAVLLVQQTVRPTTLDAPGKKVRQNESIENAQKREIREGATQGKLR